MFVNYSIGLTSPRRYLNISLIILALWFSSPLAADVVDGLYEVEIPISSQDKAERTKTIREAFSEVLVRVSGRADLLQSNEYPKIQAAIDSATRFAQQFRYRKMNGTAATDKGSLVLWVRFDEAAMTRLLRSNNLPVWGVARPTTLVWLVIDERGRRELISNNSKHPAHDILRNQAKRRGVPLRLPLLDLTDRTGLRVSDVWGNFESTILRASQRYQTEAVLVGRVFQQYRSWNARWSLYSDSRRRDWTLSGDSLNEVLLPGIDTTAESLALRYAQVGESNDGSILIEVRDIKNLADYNRALKYLNTLSHVTAVHPYQIVANATIFELSTPAGRLGVARAVALGHTLANEPVETVPIPDNPVPETNTVVAINQTPIVPDLIYRLIP